MNVSETIRDLWEESRTQSDRRRELVHAAVADGKKPAIADLFAVGWTIEEFEIAFQDGAAVFADQAAIAEAQKLTAGPLCEAQKAAAMVNDDLQRIDKLGETIVKAVFTTTRAASGRVRARASEIFSERVRRQNSPNVRYLKGMRDGRYNIEERLKAARSGLHDVKDGRGVDSQLHQIKALEEELAAFLRRPIEFSSQPNLPPAVDPRDLDLYQVALDAIVDAMRKMLPVDQQAATFIRLAAAFTAAAEQNPSGQGGT